MVYGLSLIFIFLLLLLFRVPVAFSLLLTSFIYILITDKVPPTFVPQAMVNGSSTYLILAVPFFMIVGELMNTAGVTQRIFRFADTLVGHITGGLAHVNVLASFMFAGISGSAAADAAGLGTVEIKAMKEKGFDADFSAGITAASSTMGPIIPPSSPLVIYGIMAGVSIGSLFLAGIIVGIIMAIFMMVTVYIISRKRGYPKNSRASFSEVFIAFKEAFWALLTPVILVSGILTGFFTPTEAAAVCVGYVLILGLFVYRELTFKKMMEIGRNTVEVIGMVMLLVAAGNVFAWMMGAEKIAEKSSVFLFGISYSDTMVLVAITLFLLFIGTFMETISAMLISVPILLPIVHQMGMDPVQFGIVLVLNLMIGLLTPPMAVVLFITSKIAEISFDRAFKAVLPYYIPLFIILILIMIYPPLTLFLPDLVYGK